MEKILFQKKSKVSEFEIQAEIYSILKLNNYHVVGEYKYQNCRFDLIVFVENVAVCIIETKSWVNKKEPTNTKQIEKYSKFDIPVIICGNKESIFKTIRRVEKIVNNFKKGNPQNYRLY